MSEPTPAPSLASDAAEGGVIHLVDAPGTPSPNTGPWDDTSGAPDPAAVASLVRDGGHESNASGADLRAAALELDEQLVSAVDITRHLGVPLGVVRGWLREDAHA